MPKTSCKIIFFFVAAFLLWGCGIEDFPYISPIPDGNIRREFNDRATVPIPNVYEASPFLRFEIFYRIYVSDILINSTTSPGVFRDISTTLDSDFNNINQYIGSTTQVNVDMGRHFEGRGYYRLHVDGGYFANSVLTQSVWGTRLEFDFSSGRSPRMTAGGTTYTLWRSTGTNRTFQPQPDRLFLNREELSRPENITAELNADVVNKQNITAGVPRYTYVAMFIMAVGINAATYTEVYSTPALVHVFQLPN